jgi:hypothetical protein
MLFSLSCCGNFSTCPVVRNFFQTKSMEGERDGLGENSIAAEMNTTIFVGWINYRAGRATMIGRNPSQSLPLGD